jgi:hypothetical protein
MSQGFNVGGNAGKDGFCRWCGRKLRAFKFANEAYWKDKGMKLGGHGDNHFCGLNCGYSFGLWFARDGKRLTPAPSAKPPKEAV